MGCNSAKCLGNTNSEVEIYVGEDKILSRQVIFSELQNEHQIKPPDNKDIWSYYGENPKKHTNNVIKSGVTYTVLFIYQIIY